MPPGQEAGAVGKDCAASAGGDDPGGPEAETLRKTVGPPGGGLGGFCSRRGACPAGMRPPLSSSQSPLSSVSACGENCARSLAPPLPTARGAAGAPFGLAKREMGRARSKEKSVWRAAVQWPSALTEVDVSVQAPILARLRARLGLLRFSQLPSRGGSTNLVGVVIAWNCFSFRCRWLSLGGTGAAG